MQEKEQDGKASKKAGLRLRSCGRFRLQMRVRKTDQLGWPRKGIVRNYQERK
jgi:hypothetical protein